MRVLLVTHAFPPFNASGSVRTGKLARFLLDRGHEVRVLTAAPLPYPTTLQSEVPGAIVTVTRWLDPLAWAGALRRKPASSTGQAAEGTSGNPKMGIGRRLRRLLLSLGIPDLQIGWYPYALAAGRRLVDAWRPEAIYASALPFTGILVARALARRCGVPWIAEYRDYFAGNPYSNLAAWRGPLDQWIERRAMRSAAACVTVSEPMGEALERRHGKPTVIALNGFDSKDLPAPVEPQTAPDEPLRLLYTGIIYPGRRDPSALFAALAMLAPDERVIVEFRGQHLPAVNELAQRMGVADRVRILPTLPHRDVLAEQARADILLLLMWDDPRDAGFYTGKLFEYVGAGRPILALGRADSVAGKLIANRDLGTTLARPDAIAAQLRAWIAEKRKTGRIAAPGPQARIGLSRQEQFERVDALLASVAAGR